MYFSSFIFLDMEPPDFDLPAAVTALPTPELQLLAMLYMAHKGIVPEGTPIEVSDRIRTAKANAK